ncbi:hypothetical protein ACM94A_002672 [Enterobacter hormaechei]
MKDYLKKLHEDYNGKYSELIEQMDREKATCRWGYGVMSAFSIDPYASELLGYKPGRMLKNNSSPGVNKQCYYMDEQNRIIEEITYASHRKKDDEWIVYRDFYIYHQDNIIGLFYGSTFENSKDSGLNKIIFMNFKNGLAKNKYTFMYDGEYSETDYIYNNDKLIKIYQRVWSSFYFERNYIIASNDPLIINESLENGGNIRIYPT